MLVLTLLFSIILKTTCQIITLNENDITIRGPINSESTNKFFDDIKNIEGDINIFINSPGGSVIDGIKIINHINMLKHEGHSINCVVDYAASMAFIILQSCTNRYALSSAVLMQHQMSLGTKGSLYNIKNYLKMIDDLDLYLEKLQSDRINMSLSSFSQLIQNDWWLLGNEALKINVVDKLVFVKCNKKLYTQRDKITYNTFFGDVTLEYSKCPLIRKHNKIHYHSEDNKTEISNLIEEKFYPNYLN
uniref:Clp protease n=1 Tax=Megaviridae environmental sample TaxID=1737588 RepID=A0A5J6VL48_9VIRU|nr:MAG: Clp protease [Megaviridae environmental sample]